MFFITSIHYQRFMNVSSAETEIAIEKSTAFTFDNRKLSVQSYGFYRFNASMRKYEFESQKNFTVKKTRNVGSVYSSVKGKDDS